MGYTEDVIPYLPIMKRDRRATNGATGIVELSSNMAATFALWILENYLRVSLRRHDPVATFVNRTPASWVNLWPIYDSCDDLEWMCITEQVTKEEKVICIMKITRKGVEMVAVLRYIVRYITYLYCMFYF